MFVLPPPVVALKGQWRENFDSRFFIKQLLLLTTGGALKNKNLKPMLLKFMFGKNFKMTPTPWCNRGVFVQIVRTP